MAEESPEIKNVYGVIESKSGPAKVWEGEARGKPSTLWGGTITLRGDSKEYKLAGSFGGMKPIQDVLDSAVIGQYSKLTLKLKKGFYNVVNVSKEEGEQVATPEPVSQAKFASIEQKIEQGNREGSGFSEDRINSIVLQTASKCAAMLNKSGDINEFLRDLDIIEERLHIKYVDRGRLVFNSDKKSWQTPSNPAKALEESGITQSTLGKEQDAD